MLKKSMTILMSAGMVVTLAGCGNKSETAKKTEDEAITATMTVWSPQEDQAKDTKWLQKQCEAFAKQHPKWKLTFKYGVCSEADASKLVGQDPSNAADVYMYANDQLGALIDAKAIAQIGGETEAEVKKTNSETMVKTVTSDGKLYGIPFTGNTWFMYYDKSVFNDEDVKSLDKMLTKGKVAFPVSNSWFVGSFFVANGGTLYGDGTDASKGVDFGGEKGYQATKTLIDLMKNKNFENDQDGSGLSKFRSGSVKAYFSGSWDYDQVKKALGKNFGAVKLPQVSINGVNKQLKSFAGSKAIGVNPNSKNQQVAVALARYLGSSTAQEAHYTLRSIIPCNTELLQKDSIKNDPLIQAQNDTINETAIVQPTITAMSQYWTPTENFGKAIVSKKINDSNYKAQLDNFVKSLNSKN